MINAGATYYELFGSKKKREQELADEKARWEQELSVKYPINAKSTDCVQLAAMVNTLQADMDKVTQDIANGYTSAVGTRWMAVAGAYRVKLIGEYDKRNCEKQQSDLDKQESLNQNLALLDKAGTVAGKTSKAATYILWGTFGVTAATILFIILKKK